MKALRLPLIALLLLATGCASGRPVRPQPTRGHQYLIEAKELEGLQRHSNLFEAVRELRPFWFSRHARSAEGIAVYLDDQRIGSALSLQRFPVNGAFNVRYLSPTEALVRYGPNSRRMPVISVESHSRGG